MTPANRPCRMYGDSHGPGHRRPGSNALSPSFRTGVALSKVRGSSESLKGPVNQIARGIRALCDVCAVRCVCGGVCSPTLDRQGRVPSVCAKPEVCVAGTRPRIPYIG